MHLFSYLLSLHSLISLGWCSHFLAITSWPTYSHYILGHRLLEGLAAKGHTVTMVSPYVLEKPIVNYTNIQIGELKQVLEIGNTFQTDLTTSSPIDNIRDTYELGLQVSELILSHPRVKHLLKSKPKYDAVIITYFFSEALLAIPKHLNARTIVISPTSTSSWCNHLVGNPAPLSHITHMFLSYVGTFDFQQRVKNYLLHAFERLYRWWVVFPRHTDVVRKYFPGYDVSELINEANPLLLVNSHTSSSSPNPRMPNVVEVGGYHLQTVGLPKGLKNVLDRATDGVVFFSSEFRAGDLSDEQKEGIVKALEKFNGTVLWRLENGDAWKLPSKFVAKKWFPQEAILAHPNTKAFITHGGMLSILEAVHYGVPFIGIPLIADQFKNVKEAEMRGYGIEIPFLELGEEKLTWALQKIIQNNSYQSTAKFYSTIMNDRIKPPLEEAVFWVEYVARNNGSAHFRNSSLDLKWFQNDMLDIALLLFIAFIIVPILVFYYTRKFYKMYVRKTTAQKIRKQK